MWGGGGGGGVTGFGAITESGFSLFRSCLLQAMLVRKHPLRHDKGGDTLYKVFFPMSFEMR